ncbi:MAG TPA: GNAT family protein [Acidimicrobiales bacterium]|nr:GNAT family protein [Acidimicrobiales bacterium]
MNDRGDAFFANFPEEHRTLLADQESGDFAFHVLVDEDGTVVGRFNLFDIADSTAVVGYRVAQRVIGRGVATSALRELCRMAREGYGLRILRAATSHENAASQRVLEKVGFVADGPTEVGGQPGLWYELDLSTV